MLVVAEKSHSLITSTLDVFCVFEGFTFFFELGLLIFLQLRFVNLSQLKFPKLFVTLLLVCRLLELAKRVFRLVPGLEGCVILADEGLISCH